MGQIKTKGNLNGKPTMCGVLYYSQIKYQGIAHETMRRHDESFTWAARLFPRQAATDVAILYAFCRKLDDIADHHPPQVAKHELANIARDIVDDASKDRLYLPHEMLGKDIEPRHILSGDPCIRQRVAYVRNQLLGRAAQYYRSADKGMRFSAKCPPK
jgi:phytoene/squalene synthetase